jgi:predicted nucleic acid-binding protein
MGAVLLDTSVLISALRLGDLTIFSRRRLAGGSRLWLSAVVLEELYAGTSDVDRHLIERLEKEFDRLDRILVPTLSDWAQAGRVLSRLAAKHHYEQVGRGRLTNDALIATSAGRTGTVVVTENERDFRLLSDFLPFHWQVAAVS